MEAIGSQETIGVMNETKDWAHKTHINTFLKR